IDSAGSAMNCVQLQRRLSPSSVVTVNSQASDDMRGVGPAERTGKSLVRYWPGGSCRLLSRRRPRKPLLMMPIGAPPLSASLAPTSSGANLIWPQPNLAPCRVSWLGHGSCSGHRSSNPKDLEGNSMSAIPVVFVHGLWLHATSWNPWIELFREAGYAP